MNKREKILGLIVLVLVSGLLLYKVGITRVYQMGVSFGNTGDLEKLRAIYKRSKKFLEKEEKIRKDYEDVIGKDTTPSADSAKDPQKVFSEFVADLCRRLGFAYPRIDPPKYEPIENVDDYSFVTLDVHTNGNMESLSKLLKGFDHEAVLIRELDLRSIMDNPKIDVTITVARMVQIPTPQKGKKKAPSRDDTSKWSSISRTKRESKTVEEK